MIFSYMFNFSFVALMLAMGQRRAPGLGRGYQVEPLSLMNNW